MKYLDLFTGIGGFTKAIENVDVSIPSRGKQNRLDMERRSPANNDKPVGAQQSHTCVGFSEIDPTCDKIIEEKKCNGYHTSISETRSKCGACGKIKTQHAAQIYKKHYPNHKNYGDITKLDTTELPDFDLLMGGFPCQAFSVAGKRRGFDDTRGTLFFEVARILRDKKPKYLLLENVKGLLSHEGGSTFATIIEVLQEIGYGVSWKVCNTKDFGIPQTRERVFIFGVREECPREILPVKEGDKRVVQKRSKNKGQENIAWALRQRDYKDGTNFVRHPLRFLNRNQKNIEGDYSFTVDASQTGGLKKGDRVRRLTPLECERLQGFPDGWTEFGYIHKGDVDLSGSAPTNHRPETKEGYIRVDVSDTQRYKCLGNAVTVKVVQSILEDLFQQ